MVQQENWLVFVDTNIFLDFYQLPGGVADKQMKSLERHTDRIILGDQIRMEFLKNRQQVIARAAQNLGAPNKVALPPILADYQAAVSMNKDIKSAGSNLKKTKSKIEKILMNPTAHDPVFQSFSRIFKANTPLNLRRPDKARFTVRNLARKRFILGYPPRKKDDTSIGDAINWEWIVMCACNSKNNEHVLIVSRDGDYGVKYNNKMILNDWLYREFKSRVSQKRKIELTDKLTDALKKLNEIVTQLDEQEEDKIIRATPDKPSLFGELFREILESRAKRSLENMDERTLGEILAEATRADHGLGGGGEDNEQN